MNKISNKDIIDLIEYKLKDTLFNLMYDILESPVEDVANPPEALKAIEGKIQQLYVNIIEYLDRPVNERKDFEKDINKLRDDIVNLAMDISKYISINDHLGNYIMKDYKLKEIEKIADQVPLNNSAIAHNLEHYLSHKEDNIETAFKKGEIMSALPLRMTRAKYNDYVSAAFKLMTKEIPSQFASATVNRLKDMFYTKDTEKMSKDFTLMAETINEIYNIEEFKEEEAEEYFSLLDDNHNTLVEAYEAISVLYYNSVYLDILNDFTIDFDFLFEDDFVVKDLYYSVCDCIRSGDFSLKENILDSLNNEIETRFDKFEKKEKEILDAIDKTPLDNISEDSKTAVNILNAINYYYNRTLDNEIMTAKGNENIDTLLDYINSVTENMSSAYRKFIKQRFLQHLPCPYSNEELVDYVHYSLSGTDDKNTILVACSDIFEIIDKDEDNKEHHHHNHHNHNCSCGHDHH